MEAVKSQAAHVGEVSNFHNGPLGLGYKNDDMGGFIFKGEDSPYHGARIVHGFALDKANVRAAEGYVTEPGFFSGMDGDVQQKALALVIVTPPGFSSASIMASQKHYMGISTMIKGSVFVFPSDFSTVTVFCDGCQAGDILIKPEGL